MTSHRLGSGQTKEKTWDQLGNEGGPFIDFVCVSFCDQDAKSGASAFLSVRVLHCSRTLGHAWDQPTCLSERLTVFWACWTTGTRFYSWAIKIRLLIRWLTFMSTCRKKVGGVNNGRELCTLQKATPLWRHETVVAFYLVQKHSVDENQGRSKSQKKPWTLRNVFISEFFLR